MISIARDIKNTKILLAAARNNYLQNGVLVKSQYDVGESQLENYLHSIKSLWPLLGVKKVGFHTVGKTIKISDTENYTYTSKYNKEHGDFYISFDDGITIQSDLKFSDPGRETLVGSIEDTSFLSPFGEDHRHQNIINVYFCISRDCQSAYLVDALAVHNNYEAYKSQLIKTPMGHNIFGGYKLAQWCNEQLPGEVLDYMVEDLTKVNI